MKYLNVKFNVLVINTSPAFFDGITNVITNIYTNIEKKNMKMDLLVPKKPPVELCDIFAQEGNRVYYFCRTKKNILRYFFKLISLIKKNQYDIVHIHGNSHTIAIELFAAYIARCKIRIAHSHNTFCKYTVANKLLTPFFDIFCTRRLACGEEAGRFMHGNHEFEIIRNGIMADRFSFKECYRESFRKKYALYENKIIGHVGSLCNAQKNQLFLLDIMCELIKIDLSYRLCLVGGGPDENMIRRKIDELGLKDFVMILGTFDDVSLVLSAFDYIVMPSNYEGLPLSLIEEQANGLKCIVSDSITREVDITGNVFFISLRKGARVWANAIENTPILNNRSLESENAITLIERNGYSIALEVQILKNIYENAYRERMK